MRTAVIIVALLVFAAGMVWAADDAPAAKWYDNITINGYFQTRGVLNDYDSNPSAQDEFTLRRLYLNVIGKLDSKTTAVMTFARVGGSGTNTDWANMYVDWNFAPQYTFRMGQAGTQMGLDLSESSSVRLTPERAVVMEGNPALGIIGLYWTGPWDRGAWVMREPDAGVCWQPRVAVGICNGQLRSGELDNGKVFSVDAEWKGTWGQAGVSWMGGKYTVPAGTTQANYAVAGGVPAGTYDRNALLINARMAPIIGIGAQAEYATGELFDMDFTGWYGQVSYNFKSHPGVAFARYEEFDPNTDVDGNSYKATHIGYTYNLTALDAVTAEYVIGELAGVDNNCGTLQWQRKF